MERTGGLNVLNGEDYVCASVGKDLVLYRKSVSECLYLNVFR